MKYNVGDVVHFKRGHVCLNGYIYEPGDVDVVTAVFDSRVKLARTDVYGVDVSNVNLYCRAPKKPEWHDVLTSDEIRIAEFLRTIHEDETKNDQERLAVYGLVSLFMNSIEHLRPELVNQVYDYIKDN